LSSASWLPVFRAIGADIRVALQPLSGTEQGRVVVGQGAGGDGTIYMDQLAEEIAVRHLEQAYRRGERFQLISEELGERAFGGSPLILVDPLDGSFNAKQGLPYYAAVLALSDGDRLGEVRLGYVLNLVSGDEFYAEAGAGAFRNGKPLRSDAAPFDGRAFAVVSFDAPTGVDPRERCGPVLQRAEKTRQLGSAAFNLCHTATGGITLQLASAPVRAFDLAGPLLILQECGGTATSFEGEPLHDVSCRLDSRTTLLASVSSEAHREALQLLREAG